MIKYRPQRGLLSDAMKEAKEFDTVEEMYKYIVEEHAKPFGKRPFEVDDLELHELNCDDERIGWKNIGYVCSKRFFEEDNIKKYGTSQAVGHYGY